MWIGLISYPLYLWHWPLLSFARTLGRGELSTTARFVAIALAGALAWATYRLVEGRVRHAKRRAVSAALLGLGLATGLAGAFVFMRDGVPDRAAVRESSLTPAVAAQFVGPNWAYMKNATCLQRYRFPDASSLSWWFCMQQSPAPPTIVLLGNSYANQLYPTLALNPRLAHHNVLSIGTCDLGMARVVEGSPDNPCYGDRMPTQWKFIIDLVRREKSIRYAVIAGVFDQPSDAYIARFKQRVDALEASGLRVIVVSPHMRVTFHPRECFREGEGSAVRDCTFPKSELDTLRSRFGTLVASLSATNPDVVFFDQNSIFCVGSACSYIRNGMPLHRDKYSHLSEHAAVLLQAPFNDWAEESIPDLLLPVPGAEREPRGR